MKIYLSPENRPKPHGKYTGFVGVYEHDVCCEIAEYERQALVRCGFEVTVADKGKTMQQRCNEANEGCYDFYQTIHTNAGGGTGATCLYCGTQKSQSYKANMIVYNQLTKLYPSKRGIVNGTLYYENRNTKMVSAYPELAFHDNKQDAKFIVENKKELGEALCKAVCEYFEVPYVEEVKNPQTGKMTVYRVQVGAFSSKENATAFQQKLKDAGFNSIVVKSEL